VSKLRRLASRLGLQGLGFLTFDLKQAPAAPALTPTVLGP